MPLPPQQQIRQDKETLGTGMSPNPFLGYPAYTSPPRDISPKPLDSFSNFNFPNLPEPNSIKSNTPVPQEPPRVKSLGHIINPNTPVPQDPPRVIGVGPTIGGQENPNYVPPRVLPVAKQNNPPRTATNSNYQANIQSLKPRGPTTDYRGLTPARTQDQINFDMASYWASPAFQARMRQDPSAKAKVEQYLASHPQLQKDYNLYLQAGNMNRPIAKQANQIKISEEQILDKIKKDLKKLNNESQIKLSENYIDEVTSSMDNFNLALKKEAEAIWDGMKNEMLKEGATEDFFLGFLKEGEEILEKIAQNPFTPSEQDINRLTHGINPPNLPPAKIIGFPLEEHLGKLNTIPSSDESIINSLTYEQRKSPIPNLPFFYNPAAIPDASIVHSPLKLPPAGISGSRLEEQLKRIPMPTIPPATPNASTQSQTPSPTGSQEKPRGSEWGTLIPKAGINIFNQVQKLQKILATQGVPERASESTPTPTTPPAASLSGNSDDPASFVPTAQKILATQGVPENPNGGLLRTVVPTAQKILATQGVPENPNGGLLRTVANVLATDAPPENPAGSFLGYMRGSPLAKQSPPPSAPAANTPTPPLTPTSAAQESDGNPFGLGSGMGGGLGGFLLTYMLGQMMGLEGPAAFLIPMLGGLTGYNFFKPSIRTT